MLLAWGASLAILFLQKDLGASLLYFGIFVVMLWVATGRAAYLVIGLILFVVGAYAGWLLFDHVQLRVDIWLHALDPAKVFAQGYGQLAQAEFGMASGGIVGTGLGQGSPGLIPFAATDFIFAAIGEELGLLGTTAVLLLILVLVGKGLRVGLRAPDGFSTLLAVGLVDAGRAPGVRDRGWGDADHPAHRRHVAVRQLRGLEPHLELRPARAARARLERAARAPRTLRAPRPGGTGGGVAGG